MSPRFYPKHSLSFLTPQNGDKMCSVRLVGSGGVGKTTLREKFLYPDYVYTYDTPHTQHGHHSRDTGPSVCIMLEDVETELVFPHTEEAEADCTLAVFSVTEASSLAAASLELEQQAGRDKALILVGNKVDLVRTREVSIAGEE